MTSRPGALTLTPLTGMPEVTSGDDLARLVVDALHTNGIQLLDGDVLVVSSKVVSKALGLRATAPDRDTVVVSQTVRVVAERTSPLGVTRVVEAAAGPVMAAAGVDGSNTGATGALLLLPADPDAAARALLSAVRGTWTGGGAGPGPDVGVIVSDTAGRPWRTGQTDFALGAAGVTVLEDLRGGADADGRGLAATMRAVADEIAAAADLVKGKSAGVPVAHLRGLGVGTRRGTGARSLVRTGADDWFGYGRAEAVRAALGVEPGSARADLVGIASVLPESTAVKAGRALLVALVELPDVRGTVTAGCVQLAADDPYRLGLAAARLAVALHGEGVATGAARPVDGLSHTGAVAVDLPASPSAGGTSR